MSKTKNPPHGPEAQTTMAREMSPGTESASAAAQPRSKPQPGPSDSNGAPAGRAAPGPSAATSSDPRNHGAGHRPGLDTAKHAHLQRLAQQAESLRTELFPTLMADAIGYSANFDAGAYVLYLERLLEEAGNPTDPVEKMLLKQLAIADFRIAQLHCSAAATDAIEVVKIYNSAAARLTGEFRRVALALSVYRNQAPKSRSDGKLKVAKTG